MDKRIHDIKLKMDKCKEEKELCEKGGHLSSAEYWYGKYKGLEIALLIISENGQ